MPQETPGYEKFSISIFFNGNEASSIHLDNCTNMEFVPFGLRFLDWDRKTIIVGGHHFSFIITQNEASPTPSDLVVPNKELVLPVR